MGSVNPARGGAASRSGLVTVDAGTHAVSTRGVGTRGVGTRGMGTRGVGTRGMGTWAEVAGAVVATAEHLVVHVLGLARPRVGIGRRGGVTDDDLLALAGHHSADHPGVELAQPAAPAEHLDL